MLFGGGFYSKRLECKGFSPELEAVEQSCSRDLNSHPYGYDTEMQYQVIRPCREDTAFDCYCLSHNNDVES